MTSPVKINTYSFPPGAAGKGTLLIGAIMLLSARKEVLAPGSPIYDYLLADKPDALATAVKAQAITFWVLWGIHGLEVPLFAYKRLYRHGVPFFSLNWFKWVATCLAGGMGAWKHFDSLVAAKNA